MEEDEEVVEEDAGTPVYTTRCLTVAKPCVCVCLCLQRSQFFLLFIFYAALGCALAVLLLLGSVIAFFNNKLKGPT